MNVAKITNIIRRQGVKDEHAVQTIVNDTAMYSEIESHQVVYAKSRAKDYLKANNRYYNRYFSVALDDNAEGHGLDSVADEDIIQAQTRTEQRELINSLLSGCDDLTRRIIHTWLSVDNPTLTSVGRRLGLHHETVKRKLRVLSDKIDVGAVHRI